MRAPVYLFALLVLIALYLEGCGTQSLCQAHRSYPIKVWVHSSVPAYGADTIWRATQVWGESFVLAGFTDMDHEVGAVVIRQSAPKELRLSAADATTQSRRLAGSLLWAEVEAIPDTWDATWGDVLLAHELGHVLGYGHVDAPGYVMSPRVREDGWSVTPYQAQCAGL